MEQEREPRLEGYGLDAETYSNFKSQVSDLQSSLREHTVKLHEDLEEYKRSKVNEYNRTRKNGRSSRAEEKSFLTHVHALQSGSESILYDYLRDWRRRKYRKSSQTSAHSFLSSVVFFAFLFGIFATFGFLIYGNIFFAVLYWVVFWYLNVALREGDDRLNAQSDAIDEENKKERDIIAEKIELIKNKILPFEEACVAYCSNYLERYHQEYLYRKRSGSEKFEASLIEFSEMLEEVRVINSKLIFKSVNHYYNSYLSDRKFDHDSQKAKKQYFHSLSGVSVETNLPILQKAVPSEDLDNGTFETSVAQRKPTLKEEYRATKTTTLEDEQPMPITPEWQKSVEHEKPAGSFWGRFLDLETINKQRIGDVPGVEVERVEPLEVHYRTPRKIDWDIVNKKKQETGLKGEDIVMVIEQEYLTSLGLPDLSGRVRHVSKEDGDGSGYDILSYFPDGKEKYIEVKSTTKSTGSSFYLSRNELDFLKNNTENAQVHRVFNVSEEDDDGIPYLQIYTASDILESSQITPTQYKVKIG